MKRLMIIFSCLFMSSLSYTANKMSMVTYFPVPYVAYSQVNVDQQLDVGLTTTCSMNLGCSQSNTNLKANTVNLKGGKLELNNGKGVLGNSILLGSTNGTGKIQFKDVRIQGGNMQSVNADTVNVQTLNLFGKPFPSCKEKDGTGQMKWQKLKLQRYSGTDADGELYLTCGELAESEPEEECTLSWESCWEDAKYFNPTTCSCYENFTLQYSDISFAYAQFPSGSEVKCLGHFESYINNQGTYANANGSDSFANVRNRTLMSLYPQGANGKKTYPLDTPVRFPTRFGTNYMTVKTPREMIYQCAFQKDMVLKKLPCNPTDQKCWEICKNTPKGVLFWDAEFFTNNAPIPAFQPRSSNGDEVKSNQSYCVNELRAGAMSSSGRTFVGWPCMSFDIRFWTCVPGGGSVYREERSEWSPNTSVKVEVID